MIKNVILSSIVAIAKNHVIGNGGGMIWHLPEDLKHFKRTTLGKPIIMGRKSYESLGKPLPGRPNLVISRKYDALEIGAPSSVFKDMEAPDIGTPPSQIINPGPFLFHTIEDSLAAARAMANELNVDEIFITGGGEIYKQTLPITQRLYLTVIDRDYEGDTVFPEINWDEWNIIHEDRRAGDPAYTFFTLERR
jgi:dihydrofolate reductase